MLGCVFVLGTLFNWRITCGFLMIQGGICGWMLLSTFVTEIADSWRIGSIRRPNGLIVFFFLSILLFLFTVEDTVLSWVGWAGFQFCVILQSQFFTSEL